MILKVGFAKAQGFVPLAWAIEAFEGIPYSHIYFRWTDDVTSQELVFETTTGGGTQLVSLPTFQSKYKIVSEFEFTLTDANAAKFHAFCAKYQGDAYAVWQMLSVAVCLAFGLKKNPITQAGKDYCAELCLLLMQTLPDVFIGEEKIKEDPGAVGLKVLYCVISRIPAVKKTV